jgi:HSP20 family protein
MSSRSNPFEELERLFDRMSRQFDDASRRWGSDEPAVWWESEDPFDQWESEFESMAIDLAEHDDEFVASVDLPGFERDEVEVRVTDHTLRIEAEHEESTEESEENYLRRERRHESVSRSIRLPDEVDTDAVSASMNNGVLTVTLPKLESENAREIEIE